MIVNDDDSWPEELLTYVRVKMNHRDLAPS